MMKSFRILLLAFVASVSAVHAQHPSIMLTKKNVEAVRAGLQKYPLLKSSYDEVKDLADKAISGPINVPTPTDGGGGITHEQHKENYKQAVACGVAFQLTKDPKYAEHIRKMLLHYASVYNTWPRHPKRKQTPGGKMFWQNLNDCVWLVYMIQAYDCVYDYIGKSDRQKIEDDLFTSVVKELTEVNGKIFNMIHNHGTWSTAAVGMTGYVLGKKEWVEMALKGSKKDGSAGFLKQIDELFSPDGYYAEGPYYLRYAIHPFIIFARAIQQYQPELKIYDYRNGVLKKAVESDLQSTYTNKVFIPINDALKDKTYETEELVYAVDIAYGDMNAPDYMLDIAQQQKRVIVSDAGLKVARAIHEGKAKPFVYKPMWISDGKEGNGGGLALMRSGNNTNHTLAVLKATTQGMGHGHFDRLNVLFFDRNVEVLTDYGSVRFLNVETKTGGGYTKENDTWGKQTIAHNTLVVDKKSHFAADVDDAENHHPDKVFFEANERFQVASAKEINAYKGVEMLRTAILFKPEKAESPLLIDVFKVKSDTTHRYDLPFWYQGHITNTPFTIQTNNRQMNTLGDKFGYQHIWHTATGKLASSNGQITFLNNRKFYTTTFLADSTTQVLFGLSGASDPNMNIRNEKCFILSQPKVANHTFINITEPHGANNPIAEFTIGFMPVVKAISVVEDTDNKTVFTFTYDKKVYTITLDYVNKNPFISIK